MAGKITIYVGNLSLEVTEEELRQEFVVFGEVTCVNIMSDKYIGSGQHRGYGFVEMPRKSEAVNAISILNGKPLKGRAITTIEALPISDAGVNIPYGNRRDRFTKRTRQRV